MLIADAKPGTDGGTKRHYGNRASIGELAADYRVLGAIGQYNEAFRYKRLGGTYEFLSIPVFIQHPNGLNTVLDKAAAWAAARKVNEADLLNMRLSPDMFNLTRQVRTPPTPLGVSPARSF